MNTQASKRIGEFLDNCEIEETHVGINTLMVLRNKETDEKIRLYIPLSELEKKIIK